LSPAAWWRWYRGLPENPIYMREKGNWGKPNPFFDNLMRFSPFVVLGAIALGFCGGFSNPAFFNDNEDLFAVYCLICLPGILLSMLTIFGSLMAPALTAPMISLERDRGSWEILRATPQSMQSILLAKFFGALSRLKIWPVLFVLSLFQGAIFFCSINVMSGSFSVWSWFLGVATVLRPWLEILFAAFTGFFFSTTVRSATIALASTYVIVVFFKLFNSGLVWMGLLAVTLNDEIAMLAIGNVGPTAVYAVSLLALIVGSFYTANHMVE